MQIMNLTRSRYDDFQQSYGEKTILADPTDLWPYTLTKVMHFSLITMKLKVLENWIMQIMNLTRSRYDDFQQSYGEKTIFRFSVTLTVTFDLDTPKFTVGELL